MKTQPVLKPIRIRFRNSILMPIQIRIQIGKKRCRSPCGYYTCFTHVGKSKIIFTSRHNITVPGYQFTTVYLSHQCQMCHNFQESIVYLINHIIWLEFLRMVPIRIGRMPIQILQNDPDTFRSGSTTFDVNGLLNWKTEELHGTKYTHASIDQ